jgi:hypothetical protein
VTCRRIDEARPHVGEPANFGGASASSVAKPARLIGTLTRFADASASFVDALLKNVRAPLRLIAEVTSFASAPTKLVDTPLRFEDALATHKGAPASHVDERLNEIYAPE